MKLLIKYYSAKGNEKLTLIKHIVSLDERLKILTEVYGRVYKEKKMRNLVEIVI